jgi:hypothetical protein
MMDQPIHQAPSGSRDRWEELKPDIEILWLSEKRKLTDVILEMKTRHHFDAVCVGHMIITHF